MGERAATARRVLKTSVSESLYDRWKALAERQGMTLVALQELVMTRVLDGDDAPVGLSDRAQSAATTATSIRLRGDELAAVKAAAEREGHSLAGWVTKQVRAGLEAVLPTPPPQEQVRVGKKGNVTLRLWPEEVAAMREAATREGHSLSGWVALVARAQLQRIPVFTATEVRALHEASLQLMAIGRNINTAVKRLHAEGKWGQHNQPMLAALAAVRDMQARVDALQAAAERRSGLDG